jgi:hypothetical protein
MFGGATRPGTLLTTRRDGAFHLLCFLWLKMKIDVQPTCYVIAGPNGAGKTTFALRYLPQKPNLDIKSDNHII